MTIPINKLRLEVVLAELNVSQKDLAGKLNRREPTISNWCTHKKLPGVETLYEIADALGIDVRDLLVPNKRPGSRVDRKG